MPLSQRMVFRTEYPRWSKQRTVGLTVTHSTAANPVREWVQQRFEPVGDSELSTWNPAGSALALGFPILRRDRSEITLNVGIPVLGLSGTARLRNHLAVTAVAGWGGEAVILQRAVLDRHHAGLSLGAWGRLDHIGVDTEQSYIDLGRPEETAYLGSFGGRLTGRTVWTGNVLHGVVSVGYAPALDGSVVRVGLVVYGFQE